ncbi:Oidioi.mRNA.OKI2018_I69.PAR.g9092.t2.cds [Oikopleura dioica]|uniref:Oidioi.mRNA.OKI2018_I69.PAR.g9092.t2.cds n=1 Tax=Oikopleura dioica TaxID=34765 RepID=A0ABN7RRK0_OIKDI|nr:Oidioi.mRNA.OKI2018_I69.PAR.g9092.t2.cds [Oikopleura dioica]
MKLAFFVIFAVEGSLRGTWGEWGECSTSCGLGQRCKYFTSDIYTTGIPSCEPCDTGFECGEGYGLWSEWGPCCPYDSKSAGQARVRDCFDGPEGGSKAFTATRSRRSVFGKTIRTTANSSNGVLSYLGWNFNDFWGGGKVRTTISPTQSTYSIYRGRPTTQAFEETTELQTTEPTTTFAPLRTTVKTATTKSSRPFIPTYFPTIPSNWSPRPVTPSTQAPTTQSVVQIDLNSRRTPECKAITRNGRPIKLDLSIFGNVPENVLYSEWGEWQNCDKITKRQLRSRSCKKVEGIVFACSKDNTLGSRECPENDLQRDRRPRPKPISLDDIKYCDNQWGRFLKEATVTCLVERRCSLFRTWDDKKLTWLLNCFPKWGLSSRNKSTFKMRALYQRKLAGY